MDKGAILYIIRVVIQRILGFLLFLVGSSWGLSARSIIYFTIYILAAIISGMIMYKSNPATIRERGKVNTTSPLWDKILMLAYWLLSFFVIYFFAGREQMHLQPDILFWIGIIFYILATILTLKAMIVNTFLESTARLQADRNQNVCKNGSYSIIRHSTYSGILIWCISISLIFPSEYVILTAFAVAIVIIIRTHLEDTMLRKELHGYGEYADKVKYRLAPFIW